ncbi:hypothetical protein [Neobacillus niacini]|nr:hypothetical protein [Neobacillus niacini]
MIASITGTMMIIRIYTVILQSKKASIRETNTYTLTPTSTVQQISKHILM